MFKCFLVLPAAGLKSNFSDVGDLILVFGITFGLFLKFLRFVVLLLRPAGQKLNSVDIGCCICPSLCLSLCFVPGGAVFLCFVSGEVDGRRFPFVL